MSVANVPKASVSLEKSADTSRSDYLKKYLSTASSNASKGNKKPKTEQSGKGMRLMEEDTFLPLPPPEKKSRSAGAFIDMTGKLDGEQWDDDDEDEDDRMLRNARENPAVAESKFKNDSFVTIGDSPMKNNSEGPSQPRRAPQSSGHRDKDNSPVRRSKGRSNASDERDQSPPRRSIKKEGGNMDSNGDISPPRVSGRSSYRNQVVSRDLSPPRQRRTSGPSKSRASRSPSRIKREPGLGTEEDTNGRYAETRKRSTLFNKTRKSNRRPEESEDPERKERESKKQEELDAKYKQWNKGVAQIQQREDKLKEMEETVQEGFARYADNELMNEHLKDQLLEEDPMADYFKTKKHKVQMRSGIVYPKYQGSWAPNRFSIAPGYRWDGVNRSNGFEAKMSLVENKRRAQETEAYKSIIECEE